MCASVCVSVKVCVSVSPYLSLHRCFIIIIVVLRKVLLSCCLFCPFLFFSSQPPSNLILFFSEQLFNRIFSLSLNSFEICFFHSNRLSILRSLVLPCLFSCLPSSSQKVEKELKKREKPKYGNPSKMQREGGHSPIWEFRECLLSRQSSLTCNQSRCKRPRTNET